MTHLLGAATAWCNEPIRLCTHPPTITYIRDYVAVRGRCPSSAQVLTLGREVVSQSPPSDHHHEGDPPPFHMALWDAQLRHLMEDL